MQGKKKSSKKAKFQLKFRFFISKYTIASGNVSAVAKSIENALGKAVPVLMGFLASLLGIGGLVDKVWGVIRKIRQRIENAIVKFWTFVKDKAKALFGNIVGKVKKIIPTSLESRRKLMPDLGI